MMTEPNSVEPDDVLNRIVTALRETPIPVFNDPFATHSAIATERRTRGWLRPAAWWRLGATCAVVVIVVTVAGLLLRPQASLAEVAAAILMKPWVHVRSVNTDQSVHEAWFSPTRDISASRWRGSARFEDHRLQVYYSYDPSEQVLYRGPVVSTSEAGQFESVAEGLKILVHANRLPDKPLAHLGFLGQNRDRMKVLDQRVEKVTEQDQTWLDYRITVQSPESTEPIRMLFRVDAGTKLPRMFRAEGHHAGKLMARESQFEYPGKGPADIYDLGVPKTAKLVDRVPAGDLKRIVEALQAGRERMDNYRSVFVIERDGIPSDSWGEFPQMFYRKGNRFRRDFIAAMPRDNKKHPQQPAADVDRRQWWFDRAKQFPFYPVYVQLGPIYYTCDPKAIVDPDGYSHNEITSVHKFELNLKPTEMFPVDWVMRPEFTCRPPMGIGSEHQEPTLDLNPPEGPAGCILLSMRHTTREGRVNEQGIGLPDGHRFWLDPQRDYIAVRYEMVTRDEDGKETIISNHTVEEIARSPQGVWYATKVRLKNAVRTSDGKQGDQIYRIHVDFDAELPDALFQPPVPGRIQ